MKNSFFLFLLIFCLDVFAQKPVDEVAKNAHRHSIGTYGIEDQLLIRMPFASNLSKDFKQLESLKGKKITHIDLVYTEFPKGRSFERLNRSRLQLLFNFAPEFFADANISWNYVAQTDCNSVQEGQKMFHGFAIHYQDQTSSSEVPTVSMREKQEKQEERAKDSVIITEKIRENYISKDSTVIQVFNRFDKWKNMLIVNDWTGSMYEYGMQVVVWYKLNQKQAKNVKKLVFFNDGNETMDNYKKIGETGGIYMTDSLELSHVVSVMVETMEKGWGGDSQENDVEAILKGIEACPDCEDIILIADSHSKVRDLKLAHKIKKPVRIILCGSKTKLVPDYLELAYKTGGSLHTMEEDLENLINLNNGSVIEFAGSKFQVINGEFKEYKSKK